MKNILLVSFLVFLFTGCSFVNKQEQLTKFKINKISVKESPDSWVYISNPNETPFFSISEKNEVIAGTFIFREKHKDFSIGFVNMINFSDKENKKNSFSKLGRWPIYNCKTKSSKIKGKISSKILSEIETIRYMEIEGICFYIKN